MEAFYTEVGISKSAPAPWVNFCPPYDMEPRFAFVPIQKCEGLLLTNVEINRRQELIQPVAAELFYDAPTILVLSRLHIGHELKLHFAGKHGALFGVYLGDWAAVDRGLRTHATNPRRSGAS